MLTRHKESCSTDFSVNKDDELLGDKRATATRASDSQFPRLMCKCHCNKVLIGLRGQDLTRRTQETNRLAHGLTHRLTRCFITHRHRHTHTHTLTNAYTKAHMLAFKPAGDVPVSCSIFSPRFLITAFTAHPCEEYEPYTNVDVYK